MRSKDAHKQLARTSLRRRLIFSTNVKILAYVNETCEFRRAWETTRVGEDACRRRRVWEKHKDHTIFFFTPSLPKLMPFI